MPDKHKVFVSYHHENDQAYREQFDRVCADVIVSRSVDIGDIDPGLKIETVRQKIRDEYLRDSSVTVVLVGQQTWQRKFVDWEISSSIRHTSYNPRSGLVGFLLPTYRLTPEGKFNANTVPPRLWDNIKCGFAAMYAWDLNPDLMARRIHEAFVQKDQVTPDNSRTMFANNRTGEAWQE